MRYLSVCSGIEAATVAWHHMGWQPVAFSEIEKFPSAVLAHHYPDVPNLGDMTRFEEWHDADEESDKRTTPEMEPVHPIQDDRSAVRGNAENAEQPVCVVRMPDGKAGSGSRPCDGQSEGDSVSPMQRQTPKRGGQRMDDVGVGLPVRKKVNLADADLLVGGTPCQAFSVAGQRRSLEDERGNLSLIYVNLLDKIDEHRKQSGRPAVICVWENVPGVLSTKDNAFGCFLGAVAGEDVPLKPPGGKWSDAGCVLGPKRAIAWRVLDAQYFGVAQRRRRVFLVASARDGFRPEQILFEREGVRRDTPPSREARQGAARGVGGGPADGSISGAVTRKWAKGSGGPAGDECYNMVAQPALSNDPAHAICANEQRTYTNEGSVFQLRNVVAQPVAFKVRGGVEVDSAGKAAGKGYLGSEETAFTLAATQDQWVGTPPAMQVRRLTPTECERLQGFPDGYTAIPIVKPQPIKGQPAVVKAAADGPRYKALGNSMAVP